MGQGVKIRIFESFERLKKQKNFVLKKFEEKKLKMKIEDGRRSVLKKRRNVKKKKLDVKLNFEKLKKLNEKQKNFSVKKNFEFLKPNVFGMKNENEKKKRDRKS